MIVEPGDDDGRTFPPALCSTLRRLAPHSTAVHKGRGMRRAIDSKPLPHRGSRSAPLPRRPAGFRPSKESPPSSMRDTPSIVVAEDLPRQRIHGVLHRVRGQACLLLSPCPHALRRSRPSAAPATAHSQQLVTMRMPCHLHQPHTRFAIAVFAELDHRSDSCVQLPLIRRIAIRRQQQRNMVVLLGGVCHRKRDHRCKRIQSLATCMRSIVSTPSRNGFDRYRRLKRR